MTTKFHKFSTPLVQKFQLCSQSWPILPSKPKKSFFNISKHCNHTIQDAKHVEILLYIARNMLKDFTIEDGISNFSWDLDLEN